MAFKDIDVAILVGAMPRKQGMERKDLLKANAKIFVEQGKALDEVAKKTVKVGCVTVIILVNCAFFWFFQRATQELSQVSTSFLHKKDIFGQVFFWF